MKALYIHLHDEPDELPSTFQAAWLNNLQLAQLSITEKINATYLYTVESGSYDIVFVSRNIVQLASRPALRNWLRVLRPSGCLFLLGKMDTLVSSSVVYVEPLLERVDLASPNFVVLYKKSWQLPFEDLMKQSFAAQSQHCHAEALSLLQLALLAYPQELGVYQYLTLYYERMNWLKQAQQIQHNAIQQLPNDMVAEMTLFLTYLAHGDYATGFQLRNEYAKKYLPKHRRCHAYAAPSDALDKQYWRGENLAGKTFVVWSEFGLGDEIMFVQLAHYLKHVAKVGKLIWVVQPPIVSLVQTHADIDEVVSAKVAADVIGSLDYWAFPHDLLVHFRQPFETIPKTMPYLSANVDKLRHFATLTRSEKKRKVGLAWRGDPSHENDRYRSIHQVAMLNVLVDGMDDIQFYCVQKELNEHERAWLAEKGIPHLGDALGDFADTAALLANMDVVITVDTSIAHVAGALNLPTFVLLPYVYDWRWGTPLMKNMWYPNTVKFQLPYVGAPWYEVLLAVRHALRDGLDS